MKKIIDAAVSEFKVKLAKQFYLTMLDKCFIKASKQNKAYIKSITENMEQYIHASGERSLILKNNIYACSSLVRVFEILKCHFNKEISKISILASYDRLYHTNITVYLNTEAIVEAYYMQKAKEKLDR